MSSPFPRPFSLPRDGKGRPLLPTGFAVGVAALVIGTVAVVGWPTLVTNGPFSTLDAATEMTGGRPVPAPFVPAWTFGGAMGLPVRLVETIGPGHTVVLRNLVGGLDGPADPWYWLGTLPSAYLFLADVVTACPMARSRRPAEGFATGSSAAISSIAVATITALVAHVGLSDTPPNAGRFIYVGSTEFYPADLDGDFVGLPLWGVSSGLTYGIVFDGFGGAVASLVGQLVSAIRSRLEKA